MDNMVFYAILNIQYGRHVGLEKFANIGFRISHAM